MANLAILLSEPAYVHAVQTHTLHTQHHTSPITHITYHTSAKREKKEKKSKKGGKKHAAAAEIAKVGVNEEKVDLLLEMMKGADVTSEENEAENQTLLELEGMWGGGRVGGGGGPSRERMWRKWAR